VALEAVLQHGALEKALATVGGHGGVRAGQGGRCGVVAPGGVGRAVCRLGPVGFEPFYFHAREFFYRVFPRPGVFLSREGVGLLGAEFFLLGAFRAGRFFL
jgi:hypothetical protein